MEIYIFDRDPELGKGRRINSFNNGRIDIMFNSVGSTFSLDFLFDPSNEEHKLVANITRQQLIKIEENGVRIFTGFIMKQKFTRTASVKMMNISGYSIPAVLGNSQVPVSTYPRQHDGLTLRQITEKILAPFDIKLKVDPSVANEVDRAYDETSCSVSQTAQDYLQSLCQQRDILMTHTEGGRLYLTKAKTDIEPILHVDYSPPIYEAELDYDGDGIHSRICVLGECDEKTQNPRYSEIFTDMVPKWTTKFNPKVVEQTEGDDNDTEKVAKQIRAAELRSIILTLRSDRWYHNGKFFYPNNTITITDPYLSIYKKTTWFIESVSYSFDQTKAICEMKCVLPEVYNGKDPVNVFV